MGAFVTRWPATRPAIQVSQRRASTFA
jgi:hypothetical protein